MTKYFISDGSGPIGPYTTPQLGEMRAHSCLYVRVEGEDDWSQAVDFDELRDALPSPPLPEATVNSAPSGIRWGDFKPDQCTGRGVRQYSAVLWGLSDQHADWESIAHRTGATINGHWYAAPSRVKRVAGWVWGEFDVRDGSCGMTDFNAVVFMVPDIPAGLGHVGYGFKLDGTTWMWGSKELAGDILKWPGEPNGVFLHTGSQQQMFEEMRLGGRASGPKWGYSRYKALQVPNPDPMAARTLAEDSRRWGYALISNNCMDDAVKILNRYAGFPVVPVPAIHMDPRWVPNFWFMTIMAQERMTSDPLPA